MSSLTAIRLEHYFQEYDRVALERENEALNRQRRRTALENCMTTANRRECNGFQRIQKCRQGLEALDRRGWQRSFHQRMFHDNFIRACARIFWKREKHGTFAKDHQKILEVNGWDHLSQEVLVSTPRRFGKTISVSMFAAAMLYSCPNLEMSIYSTCKVSQTFIISSSWAFVTPETAHLTEAAQKHTEVSGAHLPRDRVPEDEGDPDQHGGDRDPRDGVRAGRPDRQLVPKQGAPPRSSCTKRQCSCRTVSSLHRSASCEQRTKRWITRSSADSCNASNASRWKRRSGWRSAAISCASLRKATFGTANVRLGLRLAMGALLGWSVDVMNR
jgi:hypothetical protein